MVLEDVELSLLMFISHDFSKKFNVLPIRRYENGIIVICSEINESVINDLKLMFNENIVPYIRSRDVVDENIEYYYGILNERQKFSQDHSENLYESIFENAISSRVTDIHMEPQKDCVIIRFRYDGELKIFKKISFMSYKFISTKIKVLSNLDITEKRISQDGKIIYSKNESRYNIRVSTLLTSKGEKISLRIHYSDIIYKNIQDLGFSDEQVQILDKYLKKKSGMIILSGPTGSGKSTTLYKFIEHLNSEKVSIYTIEDPIEYEIDGVNQSTVNEKIGLTFEKISRSILRHDPDIFMIGEIRDEETAKIAVSSSVIGHKVFSTVHAKDSISVITRLIDLGVSEFLAIDSLDLVISQRLVKKLCKCKKREFFDERIIFDTKYEKGKYSSPKGCEKCKFTGYSGRILLNEILIIDDIIKDMFSEKKSINEIKQYIKTKYFDYSFELNVKKLINSGEVYILDMERFK